MCIRDRFIQLSESVGILVANLIPGPIVATAMFNAFKGLAEGVAWSIVGMINFRVGITALVAEVFELLNTITFGKNNDINKAAGETGGEAQRARDERDAAIANAHVIMGMTEAGASALATAEAMDLSLIHISEPTRHFKRSRMPSSA